MLLRWKTGMPPVAPLLWWLQEQGKGVEFGAAARAVAPDELAMVDALGEDAQEVFAHVLRSPSDELTSAELVLLFELGAAAVSVRSSEQFVLLGGRRLDARWSAVTDGLALVAATESELYVPTGVVGESAYWRVRPLADEHRAAVHELGSQLTSHPDMAPTGHLRARSVWEVLSELGPGARVTGRQLERRCRRAGSFGRLARHSPLPPLHRLILKRSSGAPDTVTTRWERLSPLQRIVVSTAWDEVAFEKRVLRLRRSGDRRTFLVADSSITVESRRDDS